MRSFVGVLHYASHQAKCKYIKMQIILCCRNKHFDVLPETFSLMTMPVPASSSLPALLGNPSFRVVGCYNENTFLTCLLCHFGVTNLVDENAIARGFHLGVVNF